MTSDTQDIRREELQLAAADGYPLRATLYHAPQPRAHLLIGGATGVPQGFYRRFAEYAQIVTRELGDRLPRVATLNEPWCSAFLGHDLGVFAPGVQDRSSSLLVAHHLMLAHGLGLQAWRSVRSDTQLGIVLNPELCDPASDAPADITAARLAELERNDVFLNPLFGREWPAEMIEQIGAFAEQRRPGDLAICAQPLDFIGLNYYTRSIAQAPQSAAEQRRGYRFVPPDPQRPDLTHIGWEIYPQGLERVTRNLLAQWPLPPIWITENGAADNTPVTDGACDDRLRRGYLQSHLGQLAQMVASGLDIRGYYVWSLLDNFEWAHGYTQRFGVVHVDYSTQQRTAKASARWLQQLISSLQT